MSIDFTLVGAKEFDAALDAWVERTNRNTRVAAEEAGRAVQAAAASRIHSRTGRLAAEWEVQTSGEFDVFTADAYPTVVYAPIMQLGKRGAYHKAAHPFIPDEEELAAIAEKTFTEAWAKAAEE